MKVVVASNDFRVYWKGRLVYLQQFLAAKNIDFYCIEFFGKGSPYTFDQYNNNDKNWWTCLFPTNSAEELTKAAIKQTFFKELDRINPDIIITSPITFFAGALGLQWAKKNGKKFIMFDDAKPLKQFKRNFFVRWIRNSLTRQTDALWLPSADYDNEYPDINRKRTLFFYGYSCINNSLFKPSEKKADSKIILCVARLVPVKNIAVLLTAWQIIEKKVQPFKLIIIGDGPELEDLLKLKNDFNLQNVIFEGAKTNDQLIDFYQHAAGFILPSLAETWGLVVNEAMASGLPVLLSNKVNAAATLLKEGVNGFSFDPSSSKEIADAISKFVHLDDKARNEMSKYSLTLIGSMSYQNMGQNLVTALAEVNSKSFKNANGINKLLINLWDGKHDISAWDKQ